ncbi:MAG: sel1 repeat family protein, partial [Comamonas sp.]
MRFALTSVSLTAVLLTACAAQAPHEQLAPASPTVRLCEGNNCSELPRNVQTFKGEPVNVEAERRLAALTARAEADPRAAYDLGLRYLRGDGVERNSYQAIEWMRKAGDAGHGPAQFALG